MTAEQYCVLLPLVGEETLGAYIHKPWHAIIKNGYHVNNHYKTLLSWINKNTRVQRNL